MFQKGASGIEGGRVRKSIRDRIDKFLGNSGIKCNGILQGETHIMNHLCLECT